MRVVLSTRVTVRTTCDGGSAVELRRLASIASSARNRYTCNGTILAGSTLLNESK
jgi:hypothetical protein